MSRARLHPLSVALVMAFAIASPPARAANRVTAEEAARAERVLAIKRIQHAMLLREGYEFGERLERTGDDRDVSSADCGPDDPAVGSPGQSQRPSPAGNDDRNPAPHAHGAPLSVTGTLSYAHNVEVSDPTLDDPRRGGDTQSEPSVAAFGDHVIAAWNDGRGSEVSGAPAPTLPNLMHYAYSTDGGRTFVTSSTPFPVQQLGGIWTSDPVLAVDERTGEFYFAGLFDPPTDPSSPDLAGVAVMRATFNGASPPTWTLPIVVASDVLVNERVLIDKPWISVSPDSGHVYLTFTHFTDTGDSIVFVRSTDKGQHWGPMIAMNSAASTGYVQGSRPAPGLGGKVYVTWKEIGHTSTGEDFIRIRRSDDRGVSWNPPSTVAVIYDNFGTGAPGFNREQGIQLPSIATDLTTGSHRGRVYVAWNEAVNFYDSIPDSAQAGTITENEPATAQLDDTPQTAIPFTPGDGIIGAFGTLQDALGYTDLDYYKFHAEQGSTYVFYADQIPTRYTMRIFSSDGQTRLAFGGDRNGSPPSTSLIVWTCPQTGTYFLRMAIFGTTPGRYRVDTGIDAPGGPGQRARDQRDAFVSWSDDGGASWSTPSNLSAPEPGYFDDWLPEVAVADTGTVYALWYDFSDSPASVTGGYSQTHMARSDDGGSTWASLGPVSEAFTNWTLTNSNIIPNQGDYLGLFANATRVYPLWSDGRVGNPGTPDVWGAPFDVNSVQVVIEAVTTDTNLVSIVWRVTGSPLPTTAQVLRADAGGGYQSLGTISVDVDGRVRISDHTVSTASHYRYALQVTISGAPQIMGERTVVTPGRDRPKLELLGAVPNPSKKSLRIRFSLPDDLPAKLDLFDVFGRPLRSQTFQGVGPHDFSFGAGLDLKPGGYFLRLRHGSTEIKRALTIIP